MAQEFTPEQLQKLLEYAGSRLHATPEELRQTFQEGGLGALAQRAQNQNGISPQTAAQMEELLRDGRAEELLNSPAIQQLLRRLTEEG